MIINNITADGASENCLVFKHLVAMTMGKIFTKDNIKLTCKQKEVLTLKQKISYCHLIDGDVIIFIGGKIPHLVKKIVNTLESSGLAKGSRNLEFCRKPTSLAMVEKNWTQPDRGTKLEELRSHCLTPDYSKNNLTFACAFLLLCKSSPQPWSN